jgi:hypothetical protein
MASAYRHAVAFRGEENRPALDDVLSLFYLAEHAGEAISLFRLHNQKEAILSKETVDVPYLRPFLEMVINPTFRTLGFRI